MNKSISRIMLAAVLFSMVLPMGGCFKWRTRIASYTVLSTKNTHIPYTELGRGEYESCIKSWPFYINDEGVNWSDPIDALLIEKGGDMMIDGVLSTIARNYVIGTHWCVAVEGTAVQTGAKAVAPKAAPAAAPAEKPAE